MASKIKNVLLSALSVSALSGTSAFGSPYEWDCELWERRGGDSDESLVGSAGISHDWRNLGEHHFSVANPSVEDAYCYADVSRSSPVHPAVSSIVCGMEIDGETVSKRESKVDGTLELVIPHVEGAYRFSCRL